MDLLNALLTDLTSLVWLPLRPLPPALALVAWAALAGILAGLFFRYTSNQAALAAVADRVRANLLAMWLFSDQPGVTWRAQLQLLKAAGLRFWHALPAFMAMAVPFVLLLIQLAARYEYRPLGVGETAVVELRAAPGAWDRCRQARLTTPEGVTVETPALRDARTTSVCWRIRAQDPGVVRLRWEIGTDVIEKRLVVARDPQRLQAVSPQRPGRNLWKRLCHPVEPALPPEGPADALIVHYPQRTTPIFGWNVPWWATFLIASILTAVLLRPVLKVRF